MFYNCVQNLQFQCKYGCHLLLKITLYITPHPPHNDCVFCLPKYGYYYYSVCKFADATCNLEPSITLKVIYYYTQ